ncbi:S16 family serine protease, partial [Flaviflexus huanghaiensis]|uniref:S16 family serine protease n=1 Tax=Flaviflexus huanghaiensis TaxID=1111473 RepID=UPI0030CA2C0D
IRRAFLGVLVSQLPLNRGRPSLHVTSQRVSSHCLNQPVRSVQLAPGVVALGEVALTGEVRPIVGLEQRLAEAVRLGFTKALIPAGSKVKIPDGLAVAPVIDVAAAVKEVLPL